MDYSTNFANKSKNFTRELEKLEKEKKLITTSRKQRIQKSKELERRRKKRKITSFIIAGVLAASAFVTFGTTHMLADKSVGNHKVVQGDTLYSLSRTYGVSVKELKETNNLQSDTIKIGQTLKVPAKENVSGHNSTHSHLVKNGETLYSIAKKYGITVQQLKDYNGLKNNIIKVDQTLIIPKTTHVVVKGDTLFSIARKNGLTVDELKAANNLTSSTIYVGQTLSLIKNTTTQPKSSQSVFYGEKVESGTYTVVPGDTLWNIAKRFQISVDSLKKTNNIKNDYVLIGQKLTIKAPNLYKVDADVVGAIDNSTIELLISGYDEPVVLKVAYGTGKAFDLYSGAVITIIYQDSATPSLIEFRF